MHHISNLFHMQHTACDDSLVVKVAAYNTMGLAQPSLNPPCANDFSSYFNICLYQSVYRLIFLMICIAFIYWTNIQLFKYSSLLISVYSDMLIIMNICIQCFSRTLAFRCQIGVVVKTQNKFSNVLCSPRFESWKIFQLLHHNKLKLIINYKINVTVLPPGV